MFSSMGSALVIAGVCAAIVIVAGLAAEGRGVHLVRSLLGLSSLKETLDPYATVPRDATDWELLARLDHLDAPVPSTRK